jgi:hypothetical protein
VPTITNVKLAITTAQGVRFHSTRVRGKRPGLLEKVQKRGLTMKTQLQAQIRLQSATRIVVAAVAFCITFMPQAKACGNSSKVMTAGANALALAPKLTLGLPRLTLSADTRVAGNQAGENSPFIVGMWEVTMHSGNVLYEHAFQQFYADGNEMQNSALYPPEVGNMCFGTWKLQDARSLKLKHYGWLFDHGNFVGTLILTATITVGTQAARNTYSGNFVVDVVLPSGTIDPTQHAEGTMQGKRLTID